MTAANNLPNEEMNAYVLDYAISYAERAVAKARAEEREAAMKLGEARGAAMGEEKKAKEAALTMSKDGLPSSVIARYIHVDEATVKEWLKAAVV